MHNPPSLFDMPLPASIRKSLAAGNITPELFAKLRAGQDLVERGDPDQAIEQFLEALDMSGENPFTLRVIGAFMFSVGLYREALSVYLRLQENEPNELDVLHSIATLLYSLREFEPAMEMIRGLLEQHPGEASLWLTAGLIACEIGWWDEGQGFLEHSRDLDPENPTVHMNVGWMQRLRGHLDDAKISYEKALAANPDSLASKFNQALVLLAHGDFLEGLEAYEVRTKPGSHARALRDREFPLWTGGRFTRERVLIGGEQGIGDQLHFATDLAVVLEDLNDPVLEVHGKLTPLFRRTFPKLEIQPQMFRDSEHGTRLMYPWIDEARRQFDAMLPIGSVPLYVRRSRGSWAARKPGYLAADPARVAQFAQRLAGFGAKPRIGVIWKSQLAEGKRTAAYAPIHLWADFLRQFSDVTFVSLQYSANASEGIREFASLGIEIHDIPELDQFNDVDGVAALAAGLDFVVGAKTAPIMLAAAVGTPALALVGGTPWARPMANGHDPWLPALRETGGGLRWADVYEIAGQVMRDWIGKIRSGVPIATPAEAFS